MLARHLYGSGLAATPELHAWHCDCDSCDPRNEHAFRFQRDSTCSGEVISRVHSDFDEATEHMAALQAAAVDVDATPGTTSGFHVHVSRIALGRAGMLGDALREYLRWEDVLGFVAGGRWQDVRSGQNQQVTRMLNREYGDEWQYSSGCSDFDDETDHDEWLYDAMLSFDRHAWLSVNTRHQTWEFRLWNSTRSAWRMEMFVRLSRAFMTPEFIHLLAKKDGYVERNAQNLALLLDNGGFGRCAELVARQLNYLDHRVRFAPAVVT